MRSKPSRSSQGELDGFGKANQRDLAQRKADEPLKPKVPQQPLESGLFGDSHKQTEMF